MKAQITMIFKSLIDRLLVIQRVNESGPEVQVSHGLNGWRSRHRDQVAYASFYLLSSCNVLVTKCIPVVREEQKMLLRCPLDAKSQSHGVVHFSLYSNLCQDKFISIKQV